jgi:hypothetical protein
MLPMAVLMALSRFASVHTSQNETNQRVAAEH